MNLDPVFARVPGKWRVALLVGVIAVLGAVAWSADGFDAQRTDPVESSVWVMRTAGQYARFDTDLGEIDTVRLVDDPSTVIQQGSDAMLLTSGLHTRWVVDPANPIDLEQAATEGSAPSPEGTRAVLASGAWVLYLSDSGGVSVQRVADGVQGSVIGLDPDPAPVDTTPGAGAQSSPEDELVEPYSADVATIDDTGRVAVYSSREQAVRVLDATIPALVAGPLPVADAPEDDADLALALVGSRWVLLDDDSGRLWIEGVGAPVDLPGDGNVLQPSGSAATEIWVADPDGLVSVDLDSGEVRRVVEASGTPAAPVLLDDSTVAAAWLSDAGGQLWTSQGDEPVALSDSGQTLAQLREVTPVIRTNGSRAVLEESGSGLLWTVPDGRAVPISQWNPLEEEITTEGASELEDVAEQMPPVAQPDTFGVRAGTDVVLPVLLNDHDPNRKDVLSVVPEAISGLDGAFGTLRLVGDDQMVVVRVAEDAGSGPATFSYAITDGRAQSETVSVTLQVIPDGQNSAPQWCGVQDCTKPWPSLTVAPGGTASLSALNGWVDPEGDVLLLDRVELGDPSVPLRVVTGSDGTITVAHTDPNGAALTVPLAVTVSDVHGAETTKTLQVVVTANPGLELAPRMVVGAAGRTSTVDVFDTVRAGSGTYRLVDAAVSGGGSAGGLEVVANTAAGAVELTAEQPGAHIVTFTVADLDSGEEKTAVLRFVVPPGTPTLAVAPSTVYVRDHEDTTVDVLAAVQSTGNDVLTVASATSSYPTLGVDVIEASALRVRSLDFEALPGFLGTATVSVADGSGRTADGVVTVVLTDTSADEAVIAMPDTATVRAGEVVSIPVTSNDVAPRGARLTLEPDVVGSGTADELVYASGDSLRYVAPKAPGTYRVSYSVVRSGRPSVRSTAPVTITVVAQGANRPPIPRTLEARVSAGSSVRVPFSGSGIDPDGDAVRLVGLEQPAAGQGAASICEDGTAIVFVPASSLTGGEQVAFGYRVRDSHGEEASGTVRVAVRPSVAASAPPVAYTDYLRVRQGESVALQVEPMLNDHDPAGGTLELVDLRPDAPGEAGDDEYDRLSALVASTSLPQGRVELYAGDELGSHAYIYTVKSAESGSTAEGLIVVEVAAGSVVDTPRVQDTIVTAAHRHELSEGGIDVVSDKVTWPSGDLGKLTLKVWGEAAETWQATGSRITGPAPPGGAVVPFSLSGTDGSGASVQTYGLLIIPRLEDMRLGLKPGAAPIEVNEGESATADVVSMLAVGPTDDVELRQAPSVPVQRSEANCATEGDKVTYRAGNGAPWSDTCTVQVRLAQQESWSDVVVPVLVEPQDPQPILTSLSRTVAPGGTEAIDLREMTSWEGGRVGDESAIDYRTSLSGNQFVLTQTGHGVEVTAKANAVPGSRESVSVRVAAYGGLSATIELVVGVAPQDAPRGATLSRSCDVTSGRQCTVQVVGVDGEYDPFAGRPGSGLTLGQVGATGTVSCPVATVTSAGTDAVAATWPEGPKPSGGTCTVPFTVVDAQGRVGNGELTLDVRGFPAAPAAVTTAGYSESGVTLDVDLGEGVRAHPAVTGVNIYEGGYQVSSSCRSVSGSSYRCEVSGLANGEVHSFTARARNGVGESSDSSPVTTWAYRSPELTAVSAESIYDPAHTTTTTGRVVLSIGSGDDAAAFQVTGLADPVPRRGATTTVELDLPVGSQTITVTPLSRFEPPVGSEGASGAAGHATVMVIGAPIIQAGSATASEQTITVSGTAVNANGSPLPTSLLVGAFTDPNAAQCAMRNGSARLTGSSAITDTQTISGLTNNTEYTVFACGSNGFGATLAQVGTVYVFSGFDPPSVARGYEIGTTAVDRGSNTFAWTNVTQPDVRATEQRVVVQYRVDGGAWTDHVSLPEGKVGFTVEARQCSQNHPGACSAPVAVPMRGGSAPGTVVVKIPTGCVAAPSAADVAFTPAGLNSGGAAAEVTVNTVTAPGGQGEISVTTWSVTWTGSYSGLRSVHANNAAAACPVPDP